MRLARARLGHGEPAHVVVGEAGDDRVPAGADGLRGEPSERVVGEARRHAVRSVTLAMA